MPIKNSGNPVFLYKKERLIRELSTIMHCLSLKGFKAEGMKKLFDDLLVVLRIDVTDEQEQEGRDKAVWKENDFTDEEKGEI